MGTLNSMFSQRYLRPQKGSTNYELHNFSFIRTKKNYLHIRLPVVIRIYLFLIVYLKNNKFSCNTCLHNGSTQGHKITITRGS